MAKRKTKAQKLQEAVDLFMAKWKLEWIVVEPEPAPERSVQHSTFSGYTITSANSTWTVSTASNGGGMPSRPTAPATIIKFRRTFGNGTFREISFRRMAWQGNVTLIDFLRERKDNLDMNSARPREAARTEIFGLLGYSGVQDLLALPLSRIGELTWLPQ